MSSCDDKFGCGPTDTCYRAVVNTYTKMKMLGQRDEICFNSAVKVYQHHHPEVPSARAPYVIADWLD
ncbi:MAG: hypothetical protein JJ959_19195 [Nisaea sp.]|uniref:hypothetical protein n=1 Tax=Nisaea sp. TaxID=2024842 RepID=UPI001B249069|nr:hypothetical protein [Nisaea sp.]MBO6562682.1 hypothetical protein [Nisaea sp.]